MMTTIKSTMLALLTMAAVINAAQGAESTVSPNGFKSPECTYGVDMLTAADGWNLQFSQSSGRDARKWNTVISNGSVTTDPQAGDVMVLGAWDGNSFGHVAWLWGRWGEYVLVIHTNMRIGTDFFAYGGATFRYAWFRYTGGRQIVCLDNGKTYPLTAFIHER